MRKPKVEDAPEFQADSYTASEQPYNGPMPPIGQWSRIPSVTTGGKDFFYFRQEQLADRIVREWIVWLRTERRYVRQREENIRRD